MINKKTITTVILSGGRSSRMLGEDKGLMLLNGQPLVKYVVNVINHNNMGRLLISANRNIDIYQQYGEVVSDELNNFQGPLAGISKAMLEADTPYLLVLPCDSPLVNIVLIDRLIKCMEDNKTDICVADDGSKMHPTFALIKTSLKHNLSTFLDSNSRKLGLWIKQNNFHKVDLSDQPSVFTNVNTPQDLASL